MVGRDDLPEGASRSTINHFSSIPLARPTLQDSLFKPFPASRAVDHSGRGHTLTGKTWNTPDTIQDLLSLHRHSSAPAGAPLPHPEATRAEVRRFYTFGSDLNAHPDLLHGGVIATILDSTLGHAVGLVIGGEQGANNRSFTVQLNISYKAPVRTPGTVRVRAWVVRREGERKIWAEGVVESDDGRGGVVLNARGEGMWVTAKRKGEKL